MAGMTTSNEPGYYEDGNFGIRIENVCITVKKDTPFNFNNKTFCGFENVTLVPIQRKLIDLSMLSDTDIRYLNEYHREVREKLMPLMMQKFPEAVEYLVSETEPIA